MKIDVFVPRKHRLNIKADAFCAVNLNIGTLSIKNVKIVH